MSVVVVGSVNVDRLVRVAHLPAPGETVTGGVLERAGGGKGANAAVAAARLGAPVALVAAVGDDAEGRESLAEFTAEGLDVSAVAVCDAPTGVAHITIDDRAENTIVVISGANALLGAEAVHSALARLAGPGSVVVTNLEVPEAAVLAAASFCRSHGLRLVLDPAPARSLPDAVIGACEALTPNVAELEGLGVDGPEALLRAGARSVVVTRGGEGAELHEPGRPPLRVPATKVEAVDTTGAGDTFAAALAVGLHAGLEREEAVRVAVAAGAIACGVVGGRAALPALDSLR